MRREDKNEAPVILRVGQAAEMLGVSVETLRRWELDGRLAMAR
jgi:excisionase family DNA binding protein